MSKKDGRQITREFEVRRGRQSLAIGVALFLVFFLALLHKWPVLESFQKILSSGLRF